ncbi:MULTISPECIES: preprotein translocase subunit SecE [Carnobacterium]|uniref:Protein translocase subunit SecE n=1 Tax=Carnobacterium divergens TaxID=2748 RepID=A0A2R7ZTJ7_CARDV|nr:MULTISPECIES: preprotein translocase subunit SecE [Carnobacterium]MCO6018860.1 preprotein translocase subunit SecE [Carnobacterium divergens]MDT1939551.1 preprotein translocase subunit SecE [Carnobacterium divergens]MDT1941989.1 preprotein translocase subunit SecE [Carnobacterium divergens]MDT1947787.1 preprotein translocase subunit SecE [Carnobacterium divergens]MDT1950275.1 preprotein translocase subunit SecE [Carnobacterium divergens]
MGKLFGYFGSVKREMHEVTWPTKKELRKAMMTVIGTVFFFVIFFMVVDYGITSILDLFLKK